MILGATTSTDGPVFESDSAAAQARLGDDLNKFLNLLVTQLQNQDPLDPLDATEFTSQLVQFASVEQQIKANSNLEKMLTLQQTSQVSAMVGLIGTTVEATGDQVQLEKSQAQFSYATDVNARDVKINIRNASGLTVFNGDGEIETGKHDFVWDGKDNNGNIQPDGAYTVLVTALDREGNLLDVEQTVFGRVTGGSAEDGVSSIFMGDVTVEMDKVLSIKETLPEDPA